MITDKNGDYLIIIATDKRGNVATRTVIVGKIDKIRSVIDWVQISNPDVIELQKMATFTVVGAGGYELKQVTVNNTTVLPSNGSCSYPVDSQLQLYHPCGR